MTACNPNWTEPEDFEDEPEISDEEADALSLEASIPACEDEVYVNHSWGAMRVLS